MAQNYKNPVFNSRVIALALLIFVPLQLSGCADGGLMNSASGTQEMPPPQTDDSKVANSTDETAPLNYNCACKDFIDEATRSPFAIVANAAARLQTSCTYFASEDHQVYLSTAVYGAKTQKEFDAAVERARKGYQSTSETKSETIAGGVLTAFFTAVGSKSKVLSSVAFDASKSTIIETKEIHLDGSDVALPDHVPAVMVSAVGQAPWVCKKP